MESVNLKDAIIVEEGEAVIVTSNLLNETFCYGVASGKEFMDYYPTCDTQKVKSKFGKKSNSAFTYRAVNFDAAPVTLISAHAKSAAYGLAVISSGSNKRGLRLKTKYVVVKGFKPIVELWKI